LGKVLPQGRGGEPAERKGKMREGGGKSLVLKRESPQGRVSLGGVAHRAKRREKNPRRKETAELE